MLEYDDEIMKDDDWLYEEEKPKSKGGFKPIGKMQPPEWTKKGCEIVDDPAEKERLRKELEKKEKRRQQNREAQKRWQEKKKAEKEAAKAREKEEKPKKTFADVAAELEQMETPVEEPNVDESLDRLAKLREMTGSTVQESVKTEELTEDVVEEPAPDQEVVVAEIAAATTPKRDENIYLILSQEEAEDLHDFIKNELINAIKADDNFDNLSFLANVTGIWKTLKKGLVKTND